MASGMESDQRSTTPVDYRRLYTIALVVSLGASFHFGYQLSVFNPSEKMFQQFINQSYAEANDGLGMEDSMLTLVWSVTINLQTLGCAVATAFVRCVSEMLGRKRGFYVSSFLLAVGCLLSIGAYWGRSWPLLLAGRLVSGIGQGLALGLQPVYLNEISPNEARGRIGSATGFVVELGFILAPILALSDTLGTADLWPYLFLVQALPLVLAAACLPFLPESPKYLAGKRRFDDAKRVMVELRCFKDVDASIDEIRAELSESQEQQRQQLTFWELVTTKHIRRGVLLGWTVVIGGTFSGIVALSYFSTSILRDAGLTTKTAEYATIGVTVPCFAGAVLSGLLLDKVGRRPVLLWSFGVLLVLNGCFILFANLNRVYGLIWAGYIGVLLAAAICFVYGLGPGVIVWFITAELVPQRARSYAHGMTMMFLWVAQFVAGIVFYPLQKLANEFCFFLHIGPLLLVSIYLWYALPETKNKSINVIMRELGYEAPPERPLLESEQLSEQPPAKTTPESESDQPNI